MNFLKNAPQTQAGDLVQLVSPSNKINFVRLKSGGQLETHRGVLNLDDVIGIPWGSEIFTHKGSAYYVLQPSLSDLLTETRRSTQIMYPKDIGYILVTMGIGPGSHVVEAGTGSGAFTTALAWAVGSQGHVTTYENRQDVQNLARKNLERLDLSDRVTYKLRDIGEGFDERNASAIFLDLPNPFDYIDRVRTSIMPGGFFGCLLPTTNQVSRLLNALYRYDFKFVEVCEILLRHYKPVTERLRPTDRMVAHTGFLIFARSILPSQGRDSAQSSQQNDLTAQPDQGGFQEESKPEEE